MRRHVPALALVLVLAAAALSLPATAVLADDFMSFTFFTDFIQPNFETPPGVPFDMHIFVQEPTAPVIGGYECSIPDDLPGVIVTKATGPNGWTNFGNERNHRVGYQTPLPALAEWVILGTITMIVADTDPVWLPLGPSQPSSFDPPAPGYADGVNPNLLHPCDGGVAVINDANAVEARTLSSVRSLFD